MPNDRARSKPTRRHAARPTSAFYVLLGVAVACAVTMVVARTGPVAAVAFAGVVLSVFSLLSATLGSKREMPHTRSAPPRPGSEIGSGRESSDRQLDTPQDPPG